jgi:hypothetical protein
VGDGNVNDYDGPKDDPLYDDPIRGARGVIYALILTFVSLGALWLFAEVAMYLIDHYWRW